MKPIPIATIYAQNWANNNHSSVLSKSQTINSSVKSTVIFSFLKLTCIKTSPRKQVWTSKVLTFSTAANNTIPSPTKPEFLKHRQERPNFLIINQLPKSRCHATHHVLEKWRKKRDVRAACSELGGLLGHQQHWDMALPHHLPWLLCSALPRRLNCPQESRASHQAMGYADGTWAAWLLYNSGGVLELQPGHWAQLCQTGRVLVNLCAV